MIGGNFESDREDFDSQDQSEALDEANTLGDGGLGEGRSFADAEETAFEDLPEVEDLTQLGDDLRDDVPRDPDDAIIESDARGG